MDYSDFLRDFANSVGLYLALIAVLSLIELVIPFRSRRGSGVRLRTNLSLVALFFGINLLLNAAILGIAFEIERSGFGLLPPLGLQAPALVVIGIVALDLTTYVAHLLMHKSPPLWRVHQVHHADVHLDATTAFRQHPLEGLWRFACTMSVAFLLGLPAQVVAVYRLLSGLNAIFEHMNLRLWQPLDTALSAVVVTPNMHKVHHSRDRRETDTNYGNLFAVFDRLFRTYTPSARSAECEYGLDGFQGDERATDLLKLPFARRAPLTTR